MHNGIAFALCVGIVVDTYSSIFVASALLVMSHEFQEKRKAPSLARRTEQKRDFAFDLPSSPLERAIRAEATKTTLAKEASHT
jgi:hypothetical protein